MSLIKKLNDTIENIECWFLELDINTYDEYNDRLVKQIVRSIEHAYNYIETLKHEIRKLR